jgi:hypothetical protein
MAGTQATKRDIFFRDILPVLPKRIFEVFQKQ